MSKRCGGSRGRDFVGGMTAQDSTEQFVLVFSAVVENLAVSFRVKDFAK